MTKTPRLVLALAALVVAFTASVTYKLGQKGWQFELHPTPTSAVALGAEDIRQLKKLKILAQVLHRVNHNYVEPNRVKPKAMLLESLQEIERVLPEVLVRPSAGEPAEDPAAIDVIVGVNRKTFDLKEVPSTFVARARLKEILQFVGEYLSDPDVKPEDIEYAVIDGMLTTLDPHSVHMEPQSYKEMKVNTRGAFGGLGIVISIRDGLLTIISPIEGTPASRAGLKAQDKIVRINKESTVNMRLQEAVDRLRGKVNTTVKIWILRKGWSDPKPFTLTRAHIEIRSVESEMLEGGIGYVKVKNFQQNTTDHLRTHLAEMAEKAGGTLNGVVLDLRNNPGGLLVQSINVSDVFLEKGIIVMTVGAGNKLRERKEAMWKGTEPSYPVVVLVNAGSASASEIVAGALKNQDRALVLGQQTFGKGSVQVLYDLDDESALKLTVAQYLTPGEISIQSVGIVPDIVLVPVSIDKDDIDYFGGDQGVREADLEEHLTNAAIREAARPTMTLRHFVEKEDDEGDSEEGEATEVKAPADAPFEPDFETRTARNLIAAMPGLSSRAAMLERAKELVVAIQDQETGKVATALKSVGVDWVAGPGEADVAPQLTVSVDHAAATAGEEIKITATVRNRGTTPMHRLRAVTESDNRTLDDLEFAFGRIGPGETRSWTVPVRVPKDEDERSDDVTVTLHADGDSERTLASTVLMLPTHALPRPHFTYAWQLDDSKGGNGDGRMQRGEQVDIVVHVTNAGDGPVLESLAKFNLHKDTPRKFIDLKTGRASPGEIPVGETRSARFSLEIREGLDIDKFKATVSVHDTILREGLLEELEFEVDDIRAPSAPFVGALRVSAKKGTPIKAACSDTSPELGEAPAGTWLTTTHKCGEWLRVTDGEDRSGYIRAADTKAYKGKRRSPKGPVPTWRAMREPPRLTLDLSDAQKRHPEGDKVRIKGTWKDDRGLKDHTVYLYTRHGRTSRSTKLAYVPSKSKGDKTLKVDREVELKVGINRIVLIARDHDGLSSRRAIVVHRRAAGASSAVVPAVSAVTPTAPAKAN